MYKKGGRASVLGNSPRTNTAMGLYGIAAL